MSVENSPAQPMDSEVEYEKPAADLHTELFAKIPFPLGGNTLSDRMASSVMQKHGLILIQTFISDADT